MNLEFDSLFGLKPKKPPQYERKINMTVLIAKYINFFKLIFSKIAG
jgi:hypothetical protein